jgi:hypothetical protein
MRKFLIVIFAAFIAMLFPLTAMADDSALFSACNSQTQNSPVCRSQGTKTNPVNHIIKVATDIVALVTGLAAVIIIIVGGLTMVTSAGNAEAVANSRKRITYAIVGLAIVSLAWVIISFTIDRLIKT